MLVALSYNQVHRQLEQHNTQSLKRETKSIGIALVERLMLLDAELQVLVDRVRSNRSPGASLKVEHLGRGFTSLTLRTPSAEHVAGQTSELPDWLEMDQLRHLKKGHSVLSLATHSSRERELFLLRAVDPADIDRGVVIGRIRTEFLWDVPVNETTTYCVLDTDNTIIFCSAAIPNTAIRTLAETAKGATSGRIDWRTQEGSTYVGSYWSLFLEPTFAADTWLIVLGHPENRCSPQLRHSTQSLLR